MNSHDTNAIKYASPQSLNDQKFVQTNFLGIFPTYNWNLQKKLAYIEKHWKQNKQFIFPTWKKEKGVNLNRFSDSYRTRLCFLTSESLSTLSNWPIRKVSFKKYKFTLREFPCKIIAFLEEITEKYTLIFLEKCALFTKIRSFYCGKVMSSSSSFHFHAIHEHSIVLLDRYLIPDHWRW